jgi:hypothetical protein
MRPRRPGRLEFDSKTVYRSSGSPKSQRHELDVAETLPAGAARPESPLLLQQPRRQILKDSRTHWQLFRLLAPRDLSLCQRMPLALWPSQSGPARTAYTLMCGLSKFMDEAVRR